MTFPQVWNLDNFFIGGSSSQTFQSSYEKIRSKLKLLENTLDNHELCKAIHLIQEINLIIREMDSFVGCLIAQNVHDTQARSLEEKMQTLIAAYTNHTLLFDELLINLTCDEFKNLTNKHQEISFILEERRKLAKDKLSFKTEQFINDLSVNGYHGWSQIWNTAIGEMTFNFENKKIFFGQIENKLADPNRTSRKKAFESINKEFEKNKSLFAQVINQLGGFRLKVYEKRGWNDFLYEPTRENRMESATLNTMWQTIKDNQTFLVKYIERKAALLKLEKLSWYDLEAPISSLQQSVSYDEASKFIIEQFNEFSPIMASFAKKTLESSWVEAENRKGKSPGGFCTSMPTSQESRIFMTFSNTVSNLFTLAHEIGHAFHNEVIFSLPEMLQHPKMNVAETASTMAEIIVTKGAIKKESNSTKRLALLDDHLSRSVAYLMNIYARFLFETTFYEERKKGFVSSHMLCQIMEEAQKTAYGNCLETYHPLFWAAKMHFYITETPFYNFPYTFGYLFSLGIFRFAEKETNFENKYIALIKDTGKMNVEDLAQKHLNVNLNTPAFWQSGLDVLKKDVEEFLYLSHLE